MGSAEEAIGRFEISPINGIKNNTTNDTAERIWPPMLPEHVSEPAETDCRPLVHQEEEATTVAGLTHSKQTTEPCETPGDKEVEGIMLQGEKSLSTRVEILELQRLLQTLDMAGFPGLYDSLWQASSTALEQLRKHTDATYAPRDFQLVCYIFDEAEKLSPPAAPSQKKRGIPALTIPEFRNVKYFLDWYEKKCHGVEVQVRRLSALRWELTEMAYALVNERGSRTDHVQRGRRLKQNVEKLEKKSKKWQRNLWSLAECYELCSTLMIRILWLEEGMLRRQKDDDIVRADELGLERAVSSRHSRLADVSFLSEDFIARFMMENMISTSSSCIQEGLEGPKEWASRYEGLILPCVHRLVRSADFG